jgi:hypothetical protein
MSNTEVLIQICDYNHNYYGCTFPTEALLIIDNVVITIYSTIAVVLLIKIYSRRKLFSDDLKSILIGLVIASFFKIAHLATIPLSFVTTVFLHYISNVIMQSVIVKNLAVSMDAMSKGTKITKITAKSTFEKLTAFYLTYLNLTVMTLTTISNNVTIFLFALDSNSLSKYYIYHHILYLFAPFYYLFILTPLFILFNYNRIYQETIEKRIIRAGAAEAKPEILNAVVHLYYVDNFAWGCLVLSSFQMILDVVGLDLSYHGVLITKVLSEVLRLMAIVVSTFPPKKNDDTKNGTTHLPNSEEPNNIFLRVIQVSSDGPTQKDTVLIK